MTDEQRIEELLELLAGRDEKLRALQIALGHSNCYCEKCAELSRKYWAPSKAVLSARANPDPRVMGLVDRLKATNLAIEECGDFEVTRRLNEKIIRKFERGGT